MASNNVVFVTNLGDTILRRPFFFSFCFRKILFHDTNKLRVTPPPSFSSGFHLSLQCHCTWVLTIAVGDENRARIFFHLPEYDRFSCQISRYKTGMAIASQRTLFPQKNRIYISRRHPQKIAFQNWIKIICNYFDFFISCLPYFIWLRVWLLRHNYVSGERKVWSIASQCILHSTWDCNRGFQEVQIK